MYACIFLNVSFAILTEQGKYFDEEVTSGYIFLMVYSWKPSLCQEKSWFQFYEGVYVLMCCLVRYMPFC